jgi:hypothetical protein
VQDVQGKLVFASSSRYLVIWKKLLSQRKISS